MIAAKSEAEYLADEIESLGRGLGLMGKSLQGGRLLLPEEDALIVKALRTFAQSEREASIAYDTRGEVPIIVDRDDVIEAVAASVEAAPLTYAGPDPHVARDLRYLIVSAIRDMKGKK